MPTFKRNGNYIFGTQFTKAEQKAIDEEINRQIRGKQKQMLEDAEDRIDAQVLWFLHTKLGHGKKKLIQDYYDFAECISELYEYYEMDEKDGSFVCDVKLRELGVDIRELKRKECNGVK